VSDPKKWSKAAFKKFVEGLEGGKFSQYAELLNFSGSQIYSFDSKKLVAFCGGSSTNDPGLENTDNPESTEQRDARQAGEQAAEEAAFAIFGAFSDKCRAAKAAERRGAPAAKTVKRPPLQPTHGSGDLLR
jgi:hypothetical protein